METLSIYSSLSHWWSLKALMLSFTIAQMISKQQLLGFQKRILSEGIMITCTHSVKLLIADLWFQCKILLQWNSLMIFISILLDSLIHLFQVISQKKHSQVEKEIDSFRWRFQYPDIWLRLYQERLRKNKLVQSHMLSLSLILLMHVLTNLIN